MGEEKAGGLKGEADAANSGYFAVRGLLAKSVAEAGRFIVDRGVLAEGGPVLVKLIAQITARFGVIVTQKFAAQTVPVIGALGGDAIESFFKRRVGIAPGHGWFPFDQTDYIIGAAIASIPFVSLSLLQYIALVFFWLAASLAASAIGYLLGLKERPL